MLSATMRFTVALSARGASKGDSPFDDAYRRDDGAFVGRPRVLGAPMVNFAPDVRTVRILRLSTPPKYVSSASTGSRLVGKADSLKIFILLISVCLI